MDTKQSEALRLANMLEKPGYGWHSTPAECAAELQRLQSENDTLRAGYDAARLEIESLQGQAQQCGAGAGCCAQAARIEELEAQLEAVGAGGVGLLVRRAAAGALTNEGTIAAQSQQSQHEHWATPQPAPAAPFDNAAFELWWADHAPNSGREEAWAEWCALWPSQQAAQAQPDDQQARGTDAARAVYSRSMDLVRVFWQQHTQADALSMTMAELHADAERAIRAALAAPAQAEPEDLSVAYFMGLHAAKRAPQPAAQAGWCDGCSPDNCGGCMTSAAPTQAAPVDAESWLDLLAEARAALWQPANAALCERLDAFIDAARAAPAQAVPAPGEPSEAPTQAQVDERSDTVWLFIRLGQKNIRRAITLLEIDSMRAPELAFGPLLLKAIAELRKT